MIVLDTHAFVWWISSPELLSDRARARIEGEVESVLVSSISVWEVCLLVLRGRLELTMDAEAWIARAESLSALRFVPVDNGIALHSTRLPPPLHDDPADRIIVATALAYGATLVTKDRKLREYDEAPTLW